jgi:hypothetical protein
MTFACQNSHLSGLNLAHSLLLISCLTLCCMLKVAIPLTSRFPIKTTLVNNSMLCRLFASVPPPTSYLHHSGDASYAVPVTMTGGSGEFLFKVID